MESLTLRNCASAFLAGLLVLACGLVLRPRRRPRYPPGPKGLPLVGNMLDIPTEYAWERYYELGKEYGSDVLFFRVLGSHFLVLNSAAAANELLEKRANIYSDRPQTVVLHELTGWDQNWAFWEYGEGWKQARKMFHQHFRPSAAPQYHQKQTKAARRFVKLLLESPASFAQHARYLAGSAILDAVYAFDVQADDPRIALVERGVHTLIEISRGVFLVDLIPILKYIPSWFPGAGFKRQAAQWKDAVDATYSDPYRQFKTLLRNGQAEPCVAASLLSSSGDEPSGALDDLLKSVAGTAYVGGSDTVSATLTTFILAMTMFPDAQAAAHAQLDEVLKRTRLPEMADRAALPYITAILYEVLRWQPAGPLGLPRRLMADDEYRRWHIPAGTVVLPNIWAMSHDPGTHAAPAQFVPARYLAADGTLREDVPCPADVFGFGRRVCPGRPFAQDVLWLAIAHVLSVFRMEGPMGERGEIRHSRLFTPGLISLPEPFACSFRPRFPGAENLVDAGVVG